MQNSTFLVLLRPIFAPKIKTPPPTRLGSGSCEGLAIIWTRIMEFFCSEAHPKLVKTFFGDHLISAGKTVWISVKTLFFLEITRFWQKNRLNVIEDWWKFGSSSFTVVSSFQKSPLPPLQNPGYAPAWERRLPGNRRLCSQPLLKIHWFL